MDRQPGERHARREAHIFERALDRRTPALVSGARGIGHAAGNADHLARVGAPGDLRLERGAVEHHVAVELGALIARQRAPMRERRVPLRALGRKRAPGDPLKGRVIGRDKTRAAAHLDVEVAQRHARFHRHRRDRCTGVFDDVAAPARDAKLGDDAQRHILGGDMRGERPVEADAHAPGPLHRHHLGRQNMRELGGAAAEGERAEPADRRGMAVGDRMGRARQHHAKLRRHHVRDALLRIAEIEDADAVLGTALAHGAQEGGAGRIGGVVATGFCGDGVVLHREGEVGAPHRPLLFFQRLEGMRGVQLVQHVAVDINKVAPVGATRHQMGVPDLVEQGLRHSRRVPMAGVLDLHDRRQSPSIARSNTARSDLLFPSLVGSHREGRGEGSRTLDRPEPSHPTLSQSNSGLPEFDRLRVAEVGYIRLRLGRGGAH